MKYIIYLLLFVIGVQAANINTDKIITNFAKNRNLEMFENLKDFKISGYQVINKRQIRFDYYFLKPNFHRMMVRDMALDLKLIFNGTEGWAKNSFYPTSDIDDLSKITLKTLNEAIQSPILNFEKLGYKFKFDSLLNLNGNVSYKLIMIDNNGYSIDLYLDSAKNYLYRMNYIYESNTDPFLVELDYSNYVKIKNANIPMVINYNVNGNTSEFHIDSVMFDIGLTPYDFRKPE